MACHTRKVQQSQGDLGRTPVYLVLSLTQSLFNTILAPEKSRDQPSGRTRVKTQGIWPPGFHQCPPLAGMLLGLRTGNL